jgi:hypothetical protein
MAAAASSALATIRTSTTGQIINVWPDAMPGIDATLIPAIPSMFGTAIATRSLQNARPACAASTIAKSASASSATNGARMRALRNDGGSTMLSLHLSAVIRLRHCRTAQNLQALRACGT